jgi:hypothetical protein
MFPRFKGPIGRPALIATCLFYFAVVLAVLATAAHAAQYKVVLCAAGNGPIGFNYVTNTVSPQHPNGIFGLNNYCFSTSDPAGDAGFFRISEQEPAGNAGVGAYANVFWDSPPFTHFKSAGGYTRQPNAFNEGWRSRFWIVDLYGGGIQLMTQGAGLPNVWPQWASSNIFGAHVWPFGYQLDFYRFVYALECVRPAGCDRANFNATDANTFVFVLNDDQDSQVSFDVGSPLIDGRWGRGMHNLLWHSSDNGSGMRFEHLYVDEAPRYTIDYLAAGLCRTGFSPTNGEFGLGFAPCQIGGPFPRNYFLETATLSDGAHNLSICTQDYGQQQGLNGTQGKTCDSRTIRVDNSAPGAPAGLHVTSSNPARYLDRFSAQFSLPPDSGSPITRVHYQVINAAGEVVKPERMASGVNPTEIANVEGPAKHGEYRLRVWLEDEVGWSGPAAVAAIPHDTTAPAAPQEVSVTAPSTPRANQGFDVRWHNIPDSGSPIAAVHYQVLNASGAVAVASATLEGSNPQTIETLQTPRERGAYTLRLWLSDAESNVGAPTSVSLAYSCVRSETSKGLALSAGAGDAGHGSVVLAEGQGSTVSGTLTGGESGVADAVLCVFSNVITDHDPQFLGLAVTGPDGSYEFPIAPGPSRDIEVRYRPDQRELTAHASLLTRVHPSFHIKRRVVRNKHFAVFSGEIPGPHNDQVVVVLQVRGGKGWRAFRRYRTREGGRYVMRYRFTRTTTPTTYMMRAQVRSTVGYPYLQGNSRSLPLKVVP